MKAALLQHTRSLMQLCSCADAAFRFFPISSGSSPTSPTSPTLQMLFSFSAVEAAKKAGDVIRQGFHKTKHVDHKGQMVGQEDIDALKRRKLIIPQIWKSYSMRKGTKYAPKRKKAATDLTRENLQRDDWKELEFKEYNFNAKGQSLDCGHLHPLLKRL